MDFSWIIFPLLEKFLAKSAEKRKGLFCLEFQKLQSQSSCSMIETLWYKHMAKYPCSTHGVLGGERVGGSQKERRRLEIVRTVCDFPQLALSPHNPFSHKMTNGVTQP